MKFSNVALFFFAMASSTGAMTVEEAAEIFDSSECEPYAHDLYDALEDFMLHSEGTIQAYACNPIERKMIKRAETKMVQEAAHPPAESNQCIVAGETLMAEKKHTISTTMRSTKKCKDEVSAEYANFKELEEDEEGRRLFVCGGVCLAFGPVIAGSLISSLFGGGFILGGIAISKKRRRGRKLAASLDYEEDEEVVRTCNDQEYDLSLYIESSNDNPHINMVANAQESAKVGCQETLTFDDYSVGQKLLSFVHNLDYEDDWEKKTLPLGAFTLGHLKAASDSASVILPFQFDAMTNNCATFVLDMMEFLKIPVTSTVIQYVVDHLVMDEEYVKAVGGKAEMMVDTNGEPLGENKEKMWDFVSKYVEARN